MLRNLVWIGNLLFIISSTLIIGCGATPEPVKDLGPTEYLIGPGDSLNVFVWRNPELSTTVPVRPDGKISIPLVEDMVAVGKTPKDLARDIEKVLSEYVRSPKVNVIVTGFVGQFNQQIRVVGQAANPKALPYRNNITLLDVIIEVGGLSEHAAGNRAKIVRRYGGEQSVIKVKLASLIDEGDMSQNIKMYPGDILIIPETWF
jgi:polysaccharide export outer membrane protein